MTGRASNPRAAVWKKEPEFDYCKLLPGSVSRERSGSTYTTFKFTLIQRSTDYKTVPHRLCIVFCEDNVFQIEKRLLTLCIWSFFLSKIRTLLVRFVMLSTECNQTCLRSARESNSSREQNLPFSPNWLVGKTKEIHDISWHDIATIVLEGTHRSGKWNTMLFWILACLR